MKLLLGIILAIFIVLAAVLLQGMNTNEPTSVPQAPSPAATSAPTPPNQNPSHPLIKLESPLENQLVRSPLRISGQARGNWFFEATFPVVLTNWDGLIIAQGVASAEGDWMTEEFVPFTAELKFVSDTTVSNRGSLILQKANPSGLSVNDDAYEITVLFE
jgi:hypothetical protein